MKTLLFGFLCVFWLQSPSQGTEIVTGDQRAMRPDLFQPLPGFPLRPHSLEFVHIKDGHPKEEDQLMASYLSPATISEIKRLSFEWLMLRKADVEVSSIQVDGNKLSFRFFVDVRYVKSMNLMVNGTVSGGFTAEFDGNNLKSLERSGPLTASNGLEQSALLVWSVTGENIYPLLTALVVETMSKTLSHPSTAESVRAMASPQVRKP